MVPESVSSTGEVPPCGDRQPAKTNAPRLRIRSNVFIIHTPGIEKSRQQGENPQGDWNSRFSVTAARRVRLPPVQRITPGRPFAARTIGRPNEPVDEHLPRF